jgi:hypothetical protein
MLDAVYDLRDDLYGAESDYLILDIGGLEHEVDYMGSKPAARSLRKNGRIIVFAMENCVVCLSSAC